CSADHPAAACGDGHYETRLPSIRRAGHGICCLPRGIRRECDSGDDRGIGDSIYRAGRPTDRSGILGQHTDELLFHSSGYILPSLHRLLRDEKDYDTEAWYI